jgi:hypothetical protein
MKIQKKIKIGWFILSLLYFFVIVSDFILIYPNEKNRPARDRLYGTVELIQNSFKFRQLDSIVETVQLMIVNSSPQWKIFYYLEKSCRSIDPGVKILKSKKHMRAKFKGKATIEYDAATSFISLTEGEDLSRHLFTFFPNLKSLHVVYKNIDYNERALELQDKYGSIDFTSLEKKYNKYSILILPRFIFFGFLIWLIPVSLGYLLVSFICNRSKPKKKYQPADKIFNP